MCALQYEFGILDLVIWADSEPAFILFIFYLLSKNFNIKTFCTIILASLLDRCAIQYLKVSEELKHVKG